MRIQLAGTDLNVSRLCLGTMTFGGQVDEARAAEILDRCLDAGINFIDTANVYNKGESEAMLGRLLGARRKSIVLASKVRGKMGDGPLDAGLSKQAIFRAIEATLARLKTDYLDLYYLHQPDYDVPVEESLEAMDKLVRDGKVRYVACSNYAAWQVADMHAIAARHGNAPVRVSQPMYNAIARGIEQEYLPMAKQFGVATVVYNPLAGGLLTGKQSGGDPLPGTRFDGNDMYRNRYWHPAMFAAVNRIRQVAEQHGRTMVSVALNWLLHHSKADCIILGASKVEQVDANIAAAAEGPLPGELLAVLDKVWSDLRGVTPAYNR